MNLKAISEVISAVRDYLFPYEKISKNFLKINSEHDLRIFIKEKSAFVTQSLLRDKYVHLVATHQYIAEFRSEAEKKWQFTAAYKACARPVACEDPYISTGDPMEAYSVDAA